MVLLKQKQTYMNQLCATKGWVNVHRMCAFVCLMPVCQ